MSQEALTAARRPVVKEEWGRLFLPAPNRITVEWPEDGGGWLTLYGHDGAILFRAPLCRPAAEDT